MASMKNFDAQLGYSIAHMLHRWEMIRRSHPDSRMSLFQVRQFMTKLNPCLAANSNAAPPYPGKAQPQAGECTLPVRQLHQAGLDQPVPKFPEGCVRFLTRERLVGKFFSHEYNNSLRPAASPIHTILQRYMQGYESMDRPAAEKHIYQTNRIGPVG
jgi:hypothetical protein